MRTLAGATARIGDVVGLIRGIAGQTNLLALNATIKAARQAFGAAIGLSGQAERPAGEVQGFVREIRA